MATYVIGDIQGCFDSLMALLERIAFDPGGDRLWLAGDLVNRGPANLEVLRWARRNADRLVAVLGNHDLHLLARAAGLAAAKRRDTIEDVLEAPDRDELVEWLRRRPLVHRQGDYLMVHAGLHPDWTVPEAEKLSREVERALAAPSWTEVLDRSGVPAWSPELAGRDRARAALAYLVRVRAVRADGSLCADFSGPPRAAPRGCIPWFSHPRRRSRDAVILFGHWSALGLAMGEDYVGLDTGCVWGRQLSAMRLEDRRVFSVPCAEQPALS